MTSVYIWPVFEGDDEGEGGVRRVVDAQRLWLPKHGIRVVDRPGDADVIACHIEAPKPLFDNHADKPWVAHCHGMYWSDYEWEPFAYTSNEGVAKLVKFADITTSPSDWVTQTLRRHYARDIRTVWHGVEDIESWPLRDDERKPGTGTYALWNKNRPDPVCDPTPVTDLASRMPNQRFVMTYGKEAANITITGRVPFDEMTEMVRHAGVYLATVRETFGIGTLEAMAAGVPVVGYNWGGQADIVRHKLDGWLAEPGDVAGLQEGVEWALANRYAAGQSAIRRAQEFTWDRAAELYASIYREAKAKRDLYDDSPRVSIIVTAYKMEAYLKDCLQSVKDQTDDDWECIIVDDASPDLCGDIADAFAQKDPRFVPVHNDTNKYLAEARNIGIKEAEGKYILPLDADDKLPKNAVSILAEFLDSDREVDIAYGNVRFVDEDGTTPTLYNSSQEPGHSGWPLEMDTTKQVAGSNYLPYSSMYRREVWQQTGGYRRRLKTSEDADFWTRAVSFGYQAKFCTTADTLIYRNREGSMSRVNEETRYSYVRWFPWAKDRSLAPAGLAGKGAVALWRPRISVIIPVGPGHEGLVQDAVDSVVSQSYPHWEIVVVNDSGADLHLMPFVRVLPFDKRDVAEARNMGVWACRTPLYLPLDADDFLQPDALQWLLTAHIESEGEIIYPDFFEDPKEEGEYSHWHLPDYSCEGLIHDGAQHAITALTPVHAWQKVGGYRSGLGWEDWDFQIRVAEAGYCSRRIAAPLFVYRKHTGMRRDYDELEFNTRRREMETQWPNYFIEGKPMGCNCSGKTINPVVTTQNGSAHSSLSASLSQQEAVQITYTGAKLGTVRYRGDSGTIYSFSATDNTKWVLVGDASLFERMADFRVSGGVSALAPV